MNDLLLSLPDATATEALGAALAAAAPERCTLYLLGDLGAGKTTLARGFLQALGHAGPVRSPTYTLIEPYQLRGRDYYHLDLYRLGDPEELDYLGLRDLLGSPCVLLVEWPQRGAGMLPAADLELRLDYRDGARIASLRAGSGAGERLLSSLSRFQR